MLKTVSNVPNKQNIFTPNNYLIYVLDDYSLHLMPEIKDALFKRSYGPGIIGGRVTGDIQINHADLHCQLKQKYMELEQNLMLEQLKLDPKSIPRLSKDNMIRIRADNFDLLEMDVVNCFKVLWVKTALDGSEDYLVSDKNNDLNWSRGDRFP